MTGKAIATAIAAAIGLIATCAAGLILAVAGGTGSDCIGPTPSGSAPPSAQPPTGDRSAGRYTDEQIGNAATIVTVGTHMAVPARGWVIAVATAIQESDLRNLPGGPDGSIGLFQQRPSQGWGTPDQLRDPSYAARKFYEKLLTIDGWQQMPLTEAAQAVQRSAYPDAYARHESDAVLLVQLATDAEATSLGCAAGATGPWTQPVAGTVVSGFRTGERPTHQGVDIAATRGTPIKAASAGTVTTVRCNVSPVSHGCDVDGSPQIRGCGWYVDIEHAGDIVTRYCHMLVRPYVEQGQAVDVGEIIGIVGTSGNSSGPHLHYEVHRGGHSADTAIEPVTFMVSVGAPLKA